MMLYISSVAVDMNVYNMCTHMYAYGTFISIRLICTIFQLSLFNISCTG